MRLSPKVSIIIPVYNGSKYLREAIYSAVSQTYPNIEVIVVNDGSKDKGKTEEVALSFGDRIKYFSKENGGVSTALNYGIQNMTGEYFSWLSHDDVYTLDKIEKQIEELNKYPHDTILYGGYELVNNNTEKLGQVDPSSLYPLDKLNISLFPLLRGLINGCSLLIHKSWFEKVGLFDPNLRSTQDYDLWYKMFKQAPVRFHYGLYVKSRSHPEQGTNTMPQHEEDCSNLWIYMISNLSIEEMCEMEGSKFEFLKKTEEFLRQNTPYKKAIDHTKKLLVQEAKNVEVLLKNTKVSVIIPFYNRLHLLLDSLKSVLDQTHKNFEIILIDDGSTDDIDSIFKIIESYSCVYLYQQANKGPAAARNLGIEKAKGDYIAFLDSDDLFEKSKIEEQLRYMITNGIEISHTSYTKASVKGSEFVASGLFAGDVFPKIISGCPIATPTIMIKAKLLREYKFEENIIIGEDTCLWIKLSYNRELGGINKALTTVNVNELSAAYNIEKQKIGLANIITFLINDRHLRSFEKEMYPIVMAFVNTFNIDNQITRIPEYIIVRRSKLSRLFLSLGNEGFKTTIKKIVYKFRIKLLK